MKIKMSRILLTVALLSSIHFASAQEKLAREEALGYAEAVKPYVKQVTGISTDVDLRKPAAVKDEDYGGMALPQKDLKPEGIAQASENPSPVGQLWLHKLTLMQDGVGIPADKLCLVKVSHDGEEVTVPACALGVRRDSSGALELLVFGKGKEPLLKLPLKNVDVKQELPLSLTAERMGDEASVTVRILGKYEARMKVTELEL
jgi:hypothetical protein